MKVGYYFRVEEGDLNTIKQKAENLSMTVSSHIIKCALDKEIIVIPEVKEFRTELMRIGNNINQLTVLAHKGSVQIANLDELRKGIDNIWQSLSLLRGKRKPKSR